MNVNIRTVWGISYYMFYSVPFENDNAIVKYKKPTVQLSAAHYLLVPS